MSHSGGDDRALGRDRPVFALLREASALSAEEPQTLLDGSDPELAREVRELLAADDSSDGLLPTGAFESPIDGFAEEAWLEPGQEVGPYRILELLGVAGMGQVYLAEQSEPVRRRVALKLLRMSLALPETQRRFAAERRAMERLDHPGAAKILDTGTTGGVPFLAMELIEGRPITEFCDRLKLGVEARLRLMINVCRGVEHAHRRFLLHRDIKPSNVLVAEVDGRPVPRLGYVIGKAVRRHRVAVTAASLVLGSLLLGTVGTSIGLLRARDAEARARAEAEEARRARAESDQVVELLVQSFRASQPRAPGTTSSATSMTALELLDRGAARLDQDVLDQPSIRARLQCVIGSVYEQLGLPEKARVQLDSAFDVFESLENPDPVASGSCHQVFAEIHLDLAGESAARLQLEAAIATIEGREDRPAQRLRASVIDTFGRLERRADDLDAAEAHFRAAIDLRIELDGPRSIGVGVSMANLGKNLFVERRWGAAEDLFRRALEILKEILPEGHQRILNVTNSLAAAVASQGRLEEAAPIFETVYEGQRRVLGESHPQLGNILNNLGVLHLDIERPEKAVEYHRKALEVRGRNLGPDHPEIAWSLDNLARATAALSRFEEARGLQEQSLAIREKSYGLEHIEVGRSCAYLSDLAVMRGDYLEALELRQRALRISQNTLDADRPQNGRSLVRRGVILWHLDRREAARQSFDEGLAVLESGGDATAADLADARSRIEALEGV